MAHPARPEPPLVIPAAPGARPARAGVGPGGPTPCQTIGRVECPGQTPVGAARPPGFAPRRGERPPEVRARLYVEWLPDPLANYGMKRDRARPSVFSVQRQPHLVGLRLAERAAALQLMPGR